MFSYRCCWEIVLGVPNIFTDLASWEGSLSLGPFNKGVPRCSAEKYYFAIVVLNARMHRTGVTFSQKTTNLGGTQILPVRSQPRVLQINPCPPVLACSLNKTQAPQYEALSCVIPERRYLRPYPRLMPKVEAVFRFSLEL